MGLDRSLAVCDVALSAPLATVALPAAARSLALDPLERAAFVGGADGRIFAVELAAGGGDSTARGAVTGAFVGHTGPVTALSIAADGQRLVSASEEDGSVALWDVATRAALHTFSPKGKPMSAVLSAAPADVTPATAAAAAGAGAAGVPSVILRTRRVLEDPATGGPAKFVL